MQDLIQWFISTRITKCMLKLNAKIIWVVILSEYLIHAKVIVTRAAPVYGYVKHTKDNSSQLWNAEYGFSWLLTFNTSLGIIYNHSKLGHCPIWLIKLEAQAFKCTWIISYFWNTQYSTLHSVCNCFLVHARKSYYICQKVEYRPTKEHIAKNILFYNAMHSSLTYQFCCD